MEDKEREVMMAAKEREAMGNPDDINIDMDNGNGFNGNGNGYNGNGNGSSGSDDGKNGSDEMNQQFSKDEMDPNYEDPAKLKDEYDGEDQQYEEDLEMPPEGKRLDMYYVVMAILLGIILVGVLVYFVGFNKDGTKSQESIMSEYKDFKVGLEAKPIVEEGNNATVTEAPGAAVDADSGDSGGADSPEDSGGVKTADE